MKFLVADKMWIKFTLARHRFGNVVCELQLLNDLEVYKRYVVLFKITQSTLTSSRSGLNQQKLRTWSKAVLHEKVSPHKKQ